MPIDASSDNPFTGGGFEPNLADAAGPVKGGGFDDLDQAGTGAQSGDGGTASTASTQSSGAATVEDGKGVAHHGADLQHTPGAGGGATIDFGGTTKLDLDDLDKAGTGAAQKAELHDLLHGHDDHSAGTHDVKGAVTLGLGDSDVLHTKLDAAGAIGDQIDHQLGVHVDHGHDDVAGIKGAAHHALDDDHTAHTKGAHATSFLDDHHH